MTEKIGKVTLDYTHYPGEDLYCDGEIEQEILDIVKNYPAREFSGIIEYRKNWPVLYHLSSLRENIVDWLPMNKGMKVLEVGSGCGAITGKLSQKAGEVTCIELSKQRSLINAYRNAGCDNVTIHLGNFQDIEPDLPDDYDYVCLIGVFEYAQSYIGGKTPFHDFFRILKRHVKPGGRMVIAIENKFGMKYWAGCREDHLGTFFSGLEDYPDGGGVRTFSRKELEEIFTSCGEEEYCFYYPYPDYKFMTTLFSDRRLPQVGELIDNYRNFDRERMLLFEEKNVFDGIINEEMFPFFSNSYMAVIGKEPQVEYCRYSNDRSEEKAIKTEIVRKEGRRQVYKSALTEAGAGHIRDLYSAYQKLSARYANARLKINHCRLLDGRLPRVSLEYVEGITLTRLLDECLKNEDEEGFLVLFQEYLDRIRYGEETDIANYDMIFSNVLVNGDEWTLIDYEWTLDQRIDTREIAFRSLHCYLIESKKRNRLPRERVLACLGISPEEVEEYQKREEDFQRKVMGNRLSMSELLARMGKENFSPVEWMENPPPPPAPPEPPEPIEPPAPPEPQEVIGGRVQIYEDRGAGYSEEESYFAKQHFSEQKRVKLVLEVDHQVRRLRIDPAMEPCVCKLIQLSFNGQSVPLTNKQLITINGWAEGNLYVFCDADPNINIHLEQLERQEKNRLEAELEIAFSAEALCQEIEKKLKRRIRL